MEAVQSISVIIAALSLIYGVNAWRREHVGRRRLELAEEVLEKFYNARDAIAYMRNGLGYGGEGTSRKPTRSETPGEKQARDRAFVPLERYQQHAELFSRLQALRYRCMAVFGSDSAKPFNDLMGVIVEIRIASHQLGRVWGRWHKYEVPGHVIPSPPPEVEAKHEERARAVIYAFEDTPDQISDHVNAIVQDVEAMCRPVINPAPWANRLRRWVKKLQDPRWNVTTRQHRRQEKRPAAVLRVISGRA